jgi:vacuolar-type H+-ATPase subunit H
MLQESCNELQRLIQELLDEQEKEAEDIRKRIAAGAEIR